jgi:hypothetical protein
VRRAKARTRLYTNRSYKYKTN